MAEPITDPNFEGFDGIYIGDKNMSTLPPNEIDFSAIIAYMKETGKAFTDLSHEEIDRFRFK